MSCRLWYLSGWSHQVDNQTSTPSQNAPAPAPAFSILQFQLDLGWSWIGAPCPMKKKYGTPEINKWRAHSLTVGGGYLQPIQLQLVASLAHLPIVPRHWHLEPDTSPEMETRDRSDAAGHFKTQRMGKIQALPLCASVWVHIRPSLLYANNCKHM